MENKSKHWNNLGFSIKHNLTSLLFSTFLFILTIYTINYFLNNKIFESLNDFYVRMAVFLVLALTIAHEIKSVYAMCNFLNFKDDLRELEQNFSDENLMICLQMIRRFKSSIDTLKLRMDILKSLSPIPLAVLLFGFLVDQSKTALLSWNIYTAILTISFFVYIIHFSRCFDSYQTLTRRLLDILETRDKIKLHLKRKLLELDDNLKPEIKSI
jgi:hypothetical protein